MGERWFVFGIDWQARTVDLSREFAGFRDLLGVSWDSVHFLDGDPSMGSWQHGDCRPVVAGPPCPTGL